MEKKIVKNTLSCQPYIEDKGETAMENTKERRTVRVLFWVGIVIMLLPDVWFANKVSVALFGAVTMAQLFVTATLFVFLLMEKPVVGDTTIIFNFRRQRPLKTHLLFLIGLICLIVGDILILAFKDKIMGTLLSDFVYDCRQLSAFSFALWYLCFVIDTVVIDQHQYKESKDVIMRWFFNRPTWIRLSIFTIGIPLILLCTIGIITPLEFVLYKTVTLIVVSSFLAVLFICILASRRYIEAKQQAKRIVKNQQEKEMKEG